MDTMISYFICFFVEAAILLQYASRLFITKHSLKCRLITLCSLYAILFGTSFLSMKWLNLGMYLLINFIFLYLQYAVRFRSAIFHSVVLAAVMSMCELIVYSIIEYFTPNFFARMDDFFNTLVFALCSKLLYFAIIYMATCLFKSHQKSDPHYDNSELLLMFIPATTVFIMFTIVSICDQYILLPPLNWLITCSALFLLLMNLLIFGINRYNQRKSHEYTEMQLLLQKESDLTEYYKMLLAQAENQSILIHDIKKHLQSIALLNEQKDFDKISGYIQQLLLSSDLKETARICDHELLNAILSRYSRQCGTNHTTFLTDIRSGTLAFLADSDLTSLFCNLLDNAMEATRHTQEPYIEINTSKREKTPFVLINVVNSCRINPFTNESKLPTTTKTDKSKHGFGLKSIQKIVKKYGGDIEMYYDEKSLTFHTIITLRDNKGDK